MLINTPKGIISVKPSSDSDYPGIWITVNEKDLVLVEYDKDKEKHAIRVWNHLTPDDDYEYCQIISDEHDSSLNPFGYFKQELDKLLKEVKEIEKVSDHNADIAREAQKDKFVAVHVIGGIIEDVAIYNELGTAIYELKERVGDSFDSESDDARIFLNNEEIYSYDEED